MRPHEGHVLSEGYKNATNDADSSGFCERINCILSNSKSHHFRQLKSLDEHRIVQVLGFATPTRDWRQRHHHQFDDFKFRAANSPVSTTGTEDPAGDNWSNCRGMGIRRI